METAPLWAAAIVPLILFSLSVYIMGLFSYKNYFPVDGRTVVITGGSQGMGLGVGKILSQKGANVVIVARNKQRLEEAIKQISSAASKPSHQKFHTISADLTSSEENVRVLDEVTAWNDGQPPDIVWAVAGASVPALYIETSIETLRSQMDVNYWTAAYLAHATLRSWTKTSNSSETQGKPQSSLPRHFIMTSSTAAFVGVAGYATYSPAKAAMRSLADSLRSEINLYNGARRHDPPSGPSTDIKIHLVCPGTILTEGLETENKTKHPVTHILEEGDPAQTGDQVAEASIRGLEKDHYLITTQLLAHAMRASSLQGSPRNNWFIDTVFSWATSIAWLFIGPDMESKVFEYGKKHGIHA